MVHPWYLLFKANPMVCSQQTLVYFRVIAAVFLTGNVAWAVSGLFPAWGDQAISIGHPRYVYLTNLSSILDMLFFLCAAPVTFLQWRHPKKSPAPTGVQRVIHMLYELALTVSTLVMLMFWTAVFPKSSKFLKKHGLEMTPGMWYKNIADHLIFTVLMGLDFAFSGATMYPPHFLFIVISVLVYACVNCISRFLHGTAVYPDINFENAYTYVLLGASLALLLFLYYIFYTVGLSKPTPKSIADNEAQQRDPEPADIEQRTPGAEQA